MCYLVWNLKMRGIVDYIVCFLMTRVDVAVSLSNEEFTRSWSCSDDDVEWKIFNCLGEALAEC